MTATGHPQPTGGIAKPKTKQVLAKDQKADSTESKPAEGTTIQV